jgi:hypothetical protein
MVYRQDENLKNTLTLSPRCAARSRRSRALFILVGQRVVVELGMPDLGTYTTLVVPELGGKANEPLPHVVEGPDSIHAHPRPRY